MLKIKQSIADRNSEIENNDTLLPLDLVNVPGIVDRQVQYTESISIYPNKRTAFIGALAMLSFASGRRYRTSDNTRTNEYFVCYANSGAGKDAPRKVNKSIAVECGCASNVCDAIGSGEGLQDAILSKSKIFLQNDEFDTLVRSIAEDKSGNKESMVREFLCLFSSAGSLISKRALSNSVKRNDNGDSYCISPHLTFFGSCVGQYLFETLNDRVLENGLVARCMMVDCGKRQKRHPAKWCEVPGSIIDAYRRVMGAECVNGRWKIMDEAQTKPDLVCIEFTNEASDLRDEIQDKYDSEYDKLNDGGHAAEQSFLARAGEHMTKLAMLYAISANPDNPKIDKSAVEWASKFVTHCQKSMIRNIERFTSSNPHEANVKRILRMFERKTILTKREITRGLRLPMSVVKDVVEYMVATGDIIEQDNGESFVVTR